MMDDVKELLEILGVPYVLAPEEAEAQCAELERLGLVDGIITDDCDTFLFGGRHVFINSCSCVCARVHVRMRRMPDRAHARTRTHARTHACARAHTHTHTHRHVFRNIFSERKYVEWHVMDTIEKELALDRGALINLALLLGCDYTHGVKNVGIVNAIEIHRAFPTLEGLREFRNWMYSRDREAYVWGDVAGNPHLVCSRRCVPSCNRAPVALMSAVI